MSFDLEFEHFYQWNNRWADSRISNRDEFCYHEEGSFFIYFETGGFRDALAGHQVERIREADLAVRG